MPGITLGFASIQARPDDEPVILSWYDQGLWFGVGLKMPTPRRDIIKLKLIRVDGTSSEVRLRIDEVTREFTDGKFKYEVREPNESEVDSAIRLIKRNREYETED